MDEEPNVRQEARLEPVVRCCGNCAHASEFLPRTYGKGQRSVMAECMHPKSGLWLECGIRPQVGARFGIRCSFFTPNAELSRVAATEEPK